jgi:hypothetical protein
VHDEADTHKFARKTTTKYNNPSLRMWRPNFEKRLGLVVKTGRLH